MPDDITHIGQLIPDPKNARQHTMRNVGTIVSALHEVGAARSIVIDEGGVILAGNATIEAAAQAGIERVRVVDADGDEIIAVRRSGLNKKQKTRLALYDNRAAELAEWNVDVLAGLNTEGVLDGLFYEDELADLLSSLDVPQGAGGDDFDTTPQDGPTRVQRGEVWRIGAHRLMCGDSTVREDVERLMGGERANMVFADPPYGINIVATNVSVGGGEAYDIPFGGRKRKGYVGGGEAIKARTGLYPIQQKRLGAVGGSKPFGSQYVRGSDGASNMIAVGKYYPVIGDDSTQTALAAYTLAADIAPQAAHIWWGAEHYANALPPSSCWLVWDKENTGNFADAELAWTNQPTAVRVFRHMWNGLMKASERGVRRVHPTQKPVALAEWVFENYGKVGDIVLDPFFGSGMSLIAGERKRRKVYGCELSAEYCDVILRRAEAEGITPIERVSEGG